MDLYDEDVWDRVHPDDLWVYDKLILSKKLNYTCGPAGVRLPSPGTYIVKPITNMMGMGQGTYIHTFDTRETNFLSPGYFWCEIFKGDHLSVDVKEGKTEVVYQGISDGPSRFLSWNYVERNIQHPDFIIELSLKYKIVNYEMIGSNIIEVHLRGNPDWHKYHAKQLIPIWKGDAIPNEGFESNCAGDRLGFKVVNF